jgi:hypothetical protein
MMISIIIIIITNYKGFERVIYIEKITEKNENK